MHPKRLQDKTSHFVSTAHQSPPTTSQAMQMNIREANAEDLAHLVHHRRAMFEEMGYRDPAVLARVEKSSQEYFSQALRSGAYRAWLAEDANAHIVAGGGIVVADWPGYPGESLAKRAWILNMYTEPEARSHGLAKNCWR
jgi:hypothetical protein